MIFLANENVPLKSIHMLREAGYDVAAVVERERVRQRPLS
jgi:hypothetical protein